MLGNALIPIVTMLEPAAEFLPEFLTGSIVIEFGLRRAARAPLAMRPRLLAGAHAKRALHTHPRTYRPKLLPPPSPWVLRG